MDEANRAVADLGGVEERILLLITQHFQGGFTEDSEIERGFLRRGVGENDLMRQRGFAATRRAGDDVERKFRDAAAQDVVEAAHAGRDFLDRDFSWLAHDFLRPFAFRRVILLFHFFVSSTETPKHRGTVSAMPRAPTAALDFRQLKPLAGRATGRAEQRSPQRSPPGQLALPVRPTLRKIRPR